MRPAAPPAGPGGEPAPKRRPAAVTAGAIVLFVLGFLVVLWGLVSIVALAIDGDAVLRDQLEQSRSPGQPIPDDQIEALVPAMKAVAIGLSGLLALLGVGLGVLGFLVLRGSRTARILSWVGTGLLALCGVCNLLSVAFAPSLVGAALSVLMLLASVAVIVLLALPAANAYFAKPEPAWQPPAEFGTEPASTEFGPGIGTGTPPARPSAPTPPAAPETPPSPPSPPVPPAAPETPAAPPPAPETPAAPPAPETPSDGEPPERPPYAP